MLAKLGDKTFLDLWCYPNTFNDRDMGKGQGKEFCDLLAVCGNDVLIFSDKAISWPSISDLPLAWSRWFRKAVVHSVVQIRGAERWLRLHPTRIFIDPSCKTRLPVDLPPASDLRVHGVAVVSGAREACAAYFKDPDGSLMISGGLRGEMHLDTASNKFLPFTLGDVEPTGSFIHVFDQEALIVVMREMDTMVDFVDYLIARHDAIRSGRIGVAASEAELVAAYLLTPPQDGKRYIPGGRESGGGEHDPLHFISGGYRQLQNHPQYQAKRRADKDSFIWDRLIRLFTANVLGGTSVAFAGHAPDASLAERALRIMARESRVSRRALGYTFGQALREAERRGQDRFARVVMPFDTSEDPECAYVFLVLAYRGDWLTARGYDYYREGRAGFLKAYGQVLMCQFRHIKRVVGVALDASSRVTGQKGGSEDLMLLMSPEWTPETVAETEELRRNAGVLLPETVRGGTLSTDEFPELKKHKGGSTANRKERRATTAKRRRKA